MKKFSSMIAFSLLTLMAAGAVQAGDDGKGGTGGRPDNTPPISWDDFKKACLDPDSAKKQVPPSEIRLQCIEVSQEFVPVTPGEFPLPIGRRLTALVFSSKFHVGADVAEFPGNQKGGNCPKFKEVERTITKEVPITCDQIVGGKDGTAGPTPTQLCDQLIDGDKGSNPKLVDSDTRDTGRIIDTCGSTQIQQK